MKVKFVKKLVALSLVSAMTLTGLAGCGSTPRFLHCRMAEIDGGLTPIFFGYWLVNANHFDKEGLL